VLLIVECYSQSFCIAKFATMTSLALLMDVYFLLRYGDCYLIFDLRLLEVWYIFGFASLLISTIVKRKGGAKLKQICSMIKRRDQDHHLLFY
jgi:hypothetical protein